MEIQQLWSENNVGLLSPATWCLALPDNIPVFYQRLQLHYHLCTNMAGNSTIFHYVINMKIEKHYHK